VTRALILRWHIAGFVTGLALFSGGRASSQTWNGGGANDNWSTAGNWAGGVAPANPIPAAGTANVVFDGNLRLTPNVDAAWNINSITFNATAGSFNVGGANQLFLEAAGITDNSANTETISAPLKLGVVSTTMAFTTAAGGSLVVAGNMDWYGVALAERVTLLLAEPGRTPDQRPASSRPGPVP